MSRSSGCFVLGERPRSEVEGTCLACVVCGEGTMYHGFDDEELVQSSPPALSSKPDR